MEKLQSKAADNGIDMSVEHFLMIVSCYWQSQPQDTTKLPVLKKYSVYGSLRGRRPATLSKKNLPIDIPKATWTLG